MPPRSPNAIKRTQVSRSAGKPRPTPVLLALQQHEYLSEQSHHELGAHILQSLMEMQPNCPPNFGRDFRRLVPLGPDGDITQAWLNDTLLSVGMKNIRAGMPDPSAEPQAGVVPSCICILDGFVATNLVDREDSGNFNSVLRWLAAQCTLATVRRFLMPASVKLDSEGNYILSRASGCHWVFLDVCVETDNIAVHDWVKLPHSKYTTLARPFQALVRELHKRCPQLHPGPQMPTERFQCTYTTSISRITRTTAAFLRYTWRLRRPARITTGHTQPWTSRVTWRHCTVCGCCRTWAHSGNPTHFAWSTLPTTHFDDLQTLSTATMSWWTKSCGLATLTATFSVMLSRRRSPSKCHVHIFV